MNSTAPARNACIRIFSSPCAVMKMIGILQRSSVQLRLQFETGHSRHADIRDQTCSLVLLAGLQEFFRRGKRLRRQASHFQQALQCAAHGIIIIDDRYQFGLFLSDHG